MKFVCPLIVVEDISTSRRFYEQILEQKVKFDFGENVSFEGDFAIHLKSHFQQLLGNAEEYPIGKRTHTGEFYFETDELKPMYHKLEQEKIEFIHKIKEQPWGQRVMRVYDPDGHIVEIGESMESVVLRFHSQGLSIDEISKRSSMPKEFVQMVITQKEKK